MDNAPATTQGAGIASVRLAGLTAQSWRRAGLGALLALALALPLLPSFLVSDFDLFQLSLVFIYAVALLGLNLLIGFNGQFSLGHGAFYAIGAYTAAIMIDHWEIAYGWTLPAAGLVAGVVGFLFGIPALRIRGMYLALATLALALATPQILKYDALEEWTGGVQGIILDKPDAPWGLPLNPDQWLYYLTLAVTVLGLAVARNLLRSRTGRAIMAIRDHHTAAESMGINTALYKSLTFGVSAAYTGVSGALSALVVQFVAPDSFTVILSITFLVGSVVGGLASISGALYGAFFIQFIPNVADVISKAAPWAIYGVIMIGFMLFMPAGISGFIRLIGAWLVKFLPPGKAGGSTEGRPRQANPTA